MNIATHSISSNSREKLFYEIASAPDTMAVITASLKIPSVAAEGSAAYHELTLAAGARICELEQAARLNQN
jgi:hypothetical protein